MSIIDEKELEQVNGGYESPLAVWRGVIDYMMTKGFKCMLDATTEDCDTADDAFAAMRALKSSLGIASADIIQAVAYMYVNGNEASRTDYTAGLKASN